MKHTILGHIIGDNLKLDKKMFSWAMNEIKYKDGKPTPVSVEVSRNDKRSERQKKFYFLYLSIISKDTGETVNDLHEYFKNEYIKPIERLVMGKEIKMWPSTNNLTKDDYADYMAKIEALTGIPIPDTDGYYQDLLNQSLCD